jgi:hypothetical protein
MEDTTRWRNGFFYDVHGLFPRRIGRTEENNFHIVFDRTLARKDLKRAFEYLNGGRCYDLPDIDKIGLDFMDLSGKDSMLVTSFRYGEGKTLNIDPLDVEKLERERDSDEMAAKVDARLPIIKYTSHNCDTLVDAHILFSSFIGFAEAIKIYSKRGIFD